MAKRSPSLQAESVDEYEVSKVLKHRHRGGALQYKVSWMGFPGEDSWIPADDANAPELVESYWLAQPEDLRPGRVALRKAAAAPANGGSHAAAKQSSLDNADVKRGPGRPPKNEAAKTKVAARASAASSSKPVPSTSDNDEEEVVGILRVSSPQKPAPKKRGRPPKKRASSTSQEASVVHVVDSDQDDENDGLSPASRQAHERTKSSKYVTRRASGPGTADAGPDDVVPAALVSDEDSGDADFESRKQSSNKRRRAERSDSDASEAAGKTTSPRKKGKGKQQPVEEMILDDLPGSDDSSEPAAASSSSQRASAARKTAHERKPTAQAAAALGHSRATAPAEKSEARDTSTSRAGPVPAQLSVDVQDKSDQEEIPNELKYGSRPSWEELVVDIETMSKVEQVVVVLTNWTDGSKSWLTTEMARDKFPQKLLDFYEARTTFVDA